MILPALQFALGPPGITRTVRSERHARVGSVLLPRAALEWRAARPGSGVEEIAERALEAGAVPEPEDEPVLTVVDPDGERVEFDLATLERLRRVPTTVFEPFVEQDMEFSWVVLWDVL